MTVFYVDPAEVARCSTMVRASAETLRAEVQAMMVNIDALQASWSGAASAQFASVASNWRATQALVEQALDDISVQLAAAASTYSDAEAQTTAMFAR